MNKLNKKNTSSLNAKHVIRYTDLELLNSFLSVEGKILPRRITKLTVKQQRQLSVAVKRARNLKLLPYVINND